MTIPTNADLRAAGYRVDPSYVEGEPYPSEFQLTCPDGTVVRSRLDTNCWAVGRQRYRAALLKGAK